MNMRRFGGPGIRRHVRTSCGSGGGPALTLRGHQDFTSSNYHTIPAVGPFPNTTTETIGVIARLDSQSVSSANRHLVEQGEGNGWLIRTTGTNGSLDFGISDGTNTLVYSPAHTLPAGDVGEVHAIVGTYDGASIELYYDKARIGSGTAATGASNKPAGSAFSIGARPSTFDCEGWTIIGVTVAPAVWSLAQVQTWSDDCKAAYAAVAGPSSSYLWNADAAGDEMTESIVGTDATKSAAALTVVTTTSPTWGF